MSHIDALNKELAVGDYVIYCNTMGRSANMKFARVVALPPKKVQCVACDRGWYDGKISVDGSSWNSELFRPRVNTLAYLDRIVKVTRDMLPQDILDVLDRAFEMKAKT